MLTEVKAYRCSDGTLKTSEFEAINYECILGMKAVFNKNMGGGPGGNGSVMTPQQAAAVAKMAFKDLEKVYKDCERKINNMAIRARRVERNRAKREMGNVNPSAQIAVVT